jgi:hypothetical protein
VPIQHALDYTTYTAASDSLLRRGLHPRLQCTALQRCQHSIIRWPGRLYHGLFAFDVMHTVYINYIGYLQDVLLSLLPPIAQRTLDSRVLKFTSFRNPHDGTSSKRVTSLTSIGYMTAELRVLHLFIWAHAVGSKAEIFPAVLRDDVLTCITSLQIICFSVRGKLPFTEAEHRYLNSAKYHVSLIISV